MSTILLGILLVPLVCVILVALWAMGAYNRLVTLRNRYENAFAQIDVQLKRRHDLIPNLVNVAKGYMEHEKETLEAVVQARAAAVNATSAAAANPGQQSAMEGLSSAETQLNGALGRLMMVAESYPDLKANQNMLALQEELTSTENKVSFARQSYNDSVMTFNTTCEHFPSNLIAKNFGFVNARLFEIDEATEREAPSVEF